MLEIKQTKEFKKCLKNYKHNKKVLDILANILDLLVNEKDIPVKYKDHELKGNLKGVRELHLQPDDLLIYFKQEKEYIKLLGIGSHSKLLKL